MDAAAATCPFPDDVAAPAPAVRASTAAMAVTPASAPPAHRADFIIGFLPIQRAMLDLPRVRHGRFSRHLLGRDPGAGFPGSRPSDYVEGVPPPINTRRRQSPCRVGSIAGRCGAWSGSARCQGTGRSRDTRAEPVARRWRTRYAMTAAAAGRLRKCWVPIPGANRPGLAWTSADCRGRVLLLKTSGLDALDRPGRSVPA